MLPRLASSKTSQLLTELREANSRASAIPSSVEEFVELVGFLADAHSQEVRD